MTAAEAMPYVVLALLLALAWACFAVAANRELAEENRRLFADIEDAVERMAGKDITIAQQRESIQRLRKPHVQIDVDTEPFDAAMREAVDTLARREVKREGWSE